MRQGLKQATREAHDRLDAIAANLPVSTKRHYVKFLRAQFSARSALEDGFSRVPPARTTAPPAQAHLIAADLAELGQPLPLRSAPAILAGEEHALGAAWVIAGSSLGNRSMLARRHKAGLLTAERFLSHQAMPDYFTGLLAVIENPENRALEASVIAGALDAFAVFEAAFIAECIEMAA